jgi:CDGSH-type Zn-finger protein/uncharacterized Fe-S cluster protein YjdI
MLRERIISYRGKAIVVKFTPARCTHVAECLMGLPEVFETRRKPWISPDAAPPDRVAGVVLRCPTGALHFERTDGGPPEAKPDRNVFTVCENGPLYAAADLEIRSADGAPRLHDTRVALCRCGASKKRPFCDNRHDLVDFEERGRMDDSTMHIDMPETPAGRVEITLATNGPMLVSGPVEIVDSSGKTGFRGTRCSLCRCGKTESPPFCDGSHSRAGFLSE